MGLLGILLGLTVLVRLSFRSWSVLVLVRQILINLIGNAIKFTKHGQIIVSVRPELFSEQGISLHFSVSDTGTGIPQDKLSNIFERFYRTEESRSASQGESGLGLAIAKSVVEAHHGTIGAESQVGVGTSITNTLLSGNSQAAV